MAQDSPVRKYEPLRFGGVLNEADTPSQVGGHGLTRAQNLLYRRYGAWGVRPGSDAVYAGTATGPLSSVPDSGVRYYRVLPSILTQTVLSYQGALYTGGDPVVGTPAALTKQTPVFSAQAGTPVRFCQVRDPMGHGGGQPTDYLILTGATLAAASFAVGGVVISGVVGAGGQTITLTVNSTSVTYTVLETDTFVTIAQALVDAWNAANPQNTGGLSAAVLQTSPAIGPGGDIGIFAIAGDPAGASGNTNVISATQSGGSGGLVLSPTSPTNFIGGGTSAFSGPLCWDGTTLQPFSPWITQAFTGCVTWHDHVWYWGDPDNPDTLYASDLGSPELFNFMTEFGGYDIGAGDGDPAIRAVVPIGNVLYVFKTQSIYAITGYDFQSGEYQFSVQPAVKGHGVVTQEAVAVLRNALVFFDRTAFCRLAVGAYEVEDIGNPIPLTSGRASQFSQFDARATAGSFIVETALNDVYTGTGAVAPYLLTNIALFAFDGFVVVYDDDASAREQQYAWSVWSGWNIGYWIPFGTGENAAKSKASELPILCWAPQQVAATNPTINQFGSNPSLDNGAAIPWEAQTGWVGGLAIGSAAPGSKGTRRVLLEVDATAGVTIACTIYTAAQVTTAFTSQPKLSLGVTFPATVAPAGDEAHQILEGLVTPFLISPYYLFDFTSAGGTANSGFELVSATMDFVDEALGLR